MVANCRDDNFVLSMCRSRRARMTVGNALPRVCGGLLLRGAAGCCCCSGGACSAASVGYDSMTEGVRLRLVRYSSCSLATTLIDLLAHACRAFIFLALILLPARYRRSVRTVILQVSASRV